MRLIDADALNMAFTMLRFNEDGALRHWGDRQNWCLSGQEVEDLINSIPTAEPERKTGRWTKAYDGNDDHVKCTGCFKTYDWISQAQYYNYCPNCGAYMGGGTE